jgi:sialic acid synthase SpsE
MADPAVSPIFRIGGRPVGVGHPLFVVAEIGLNHDGSPERAVALVDAAAEAGASAVKLQSLTADRLVAPTPATLAHVEAPSLRELFARYELDQAAHRRVAERARAHGLSWFATPFDESAVDLLVSLGADALKIASGDLTHHRLIACAARTGLPLILSTGLSELAEVGEALDCARGAGATAIALLHCVSAYPTPDDQQNLGAIRTLAETFRMPVGLSDHSRNGRGLPLAVALGAALYERHIKRHPHDAVLDADVSSDPAALRALIAAAAEAQAMLGTGERTPQRAERPNLAGSRRGLYTTAALPAGHLVTDADIVALRPVAALDPRQWSSLVGARTRRALPAGHPFAADDVERRSEMEHGPA